MNNINKIRNCKNFQQIGVKELLNRKFNWKECDISWTDILIQFVKLNW